MTRLIRAAVISAGLVWCAPHVARAQAAPPVAPPATSPPPAPPTVEIPARLRPPGDSDVALCVDGSWIKTPGVAADCGAHGGLKVAMPPRRTPPSAPARIQQPAFRTTAVEQGPPPAGATARCKDGTYLFGALPVNPCSDRDGLAVRFPIPPPPPTAPRRPPER